MDSVSVHDLVFESVSLRLRPCRRTCLNLITFDNYINEVFDSSMITAKNIASEMGAKSSFQVKRKAQRKRHFDETDDHEEILEAERAFKVNYFLVMVAWQSHH
jgi:hypothetical protein